LYAKWDDIKVTEVTITNKETKIEVDDKILLTADVKPEEATNKQLAWKVDDGDKAVITYDKTGDAYLTAVKTGTVKVTATAKDGSEVSDTIELEIIPAIVSYNLDWCTTNINADHGFDGTKTLYGVALSATTIEFIKSESTDGALCGQTEDDKIYANYDASSNKLSVWSKKKIAISDNDRPDDSGVFSSLDATTSLNFDNIDTSNMTDMSEMFYYSSSLSTLDLSKFNTSNVINMKSMFYFCNNLENITFSHLFDTSNVTNMNNMFRDTKLTTLDLSVFNTSNVTDMSYMFADSSKLKTINLSSFNTEAVTNMSFMFFCCSSLSTLDLSSFNTEVVKDMSYMFGFGSVPQSLLQTIYVSEKFTTKSLDDSTSTMFDYCTKLVGGQGTAFDKDHIDAEYARIDDPFNDAPGYFTDAKQKPHELVFKGYGYYNSYLEVNEGKTVFSVTFGKEVADSPILFEFFIQDSNYYLVDVSDAKVILNDSDVTDQCTCEKDGISFNGLEVKEGDIILIQVNIPASVTYDVYLTLQQQLL